MIEKRIEICIGTDRSKTVRARLSLLLINDREVMSEHYHSIALRPGDDLTAARTALEAHIAAPNGGVPGAPWPPIPNDEWAKVSQVCAIVHAGPKRME